MEEQNNERLVRGYLSWQRDTRGRTGGTVYNYGSTLRKLLTEVGRKPLAAVSLPELEAFIDRPRVGRAHGQVGSAATRSKDAAILRSLYGYLHARGQIETNPAALLGAPSVKNENPRPIPDDDWLTLWRSDLDLSMRVALGLGFVGGLRRREVCALRPEQVSGTRLVNFTRKGGGDDILPYGDVVDVLEQKLPHLAAGELIEPLERLVDKRQGHSHLMPWGEEVPPPDRERRIHTLAEGMTDPQTLNRKLSRLCSEVGIPHYTPHQLRHSFVTNLLRAGVPLHLVQRLANHSSPAITARYAKAGQSELREWLGTVNRHE